ncbi:MAG: DUF2703 domain-containing protein [Nitrososphaerota archaeon]|nr:DUF2703 domain-containing protein [Nitrososphaerota archaeon]
MKIELLYFDGCPTYGKALKDLEEVVAELGVDTRPTLIKVESDEDAVRLQFLGSPTIRINGVDIEQPLSLATQFGLSCRIYKQNGKMLGSPSKEMLREAIKAARTR